MQKSLMSIKDTYDKNYTDTIKTTYNTTKKLNKKNYDKKRLLQKYKLHVMISKITPIY